MTPDDLDRLAANMRRSLTRQDPSMVRKVVLEQRTAIAVCDTLDQHAALRRWADQARELLAGMGPHHPTCDAHWNRPCNCGEEIARLLAALDAMGGVEEERDERVAERDRLRDALERIKSNAEAWHGNESVGTGAARALAVIAEWCDAALAGEDAPIPEPFWKCGNGDDEECPCDPKANGDGTATCSVCGWTGAITYHDLVQALRSYWQKADREQALDETRGKT